MDANVNTIEGKIVAAKAASNKALKKADAASIARHQAALDQVTAGLEKAKKETDSKFKGVYEKMGVDRSHADAMLAAATAKLNAKTVKNLGKAKKAAWEEVTYARKFFTMGLAEVTAEVKASETRLVGEIGKAAQLVVDESAMQARVNNKVKAEIARVEKLSDSNFSKAKRARGKIKELMDKNKVVAHQEVQDLGKSAEAKLAKVRAYLAKLSKAAKKDLTKATKTLHENLAQFQNEQTEEIEKMTASLKMASATTKKKLADAKEDFKAKYAQLVNTVTANNKEYEDGIEQITGVVHTWKVASAQDRELIKEESKTINADLNKAIVKAVQLGEAKAKEVEDRATENAESMKRALTIEISQQVERMADTVLKTVLDGRGTIANNYLSVKGYAGAASDTIMDYVQKGHGKGLSAIGDLLQAIAAVSKVKTKGAEGVSAGLGEIVPPFGGSPIPEVKDITKVNGLVDEYTKTFATVRMGYQWGIGKYLLEKFAESMMKEGVLTIGKKSGSAGQWVYINGKALGLSSRMGEFEAVGCRLAAYQGFLSKLAAKLPKKKAAAVERLSVPPPEWPGNL